MKQRKPNCRLPASDAHHGRPVDLDARRMLEAVVLEAERAAECLSAVLRTIGALPSKARPDCQPVPVAPETALKIAAAMRLYQWEEAGLRQHLKGSLPSAEQVVNDIINTPKIDDQRYPGHELASSVLSAWLRHMAWVPVARHADVIINDIDINVVLDQLAVLLWQNRHLVQNQKGEN